MSRRGARRTFAALAARIHRGLWLAVLALVLLVPPAVLAQVPESLTGRPIARIEVAGPTGAVDAASQTSAFVGRPIDRVVVRELIGALLESGGYSDVQVDVDDTNGEVVLFVRVEPRLRIIRIDVFGNDVFSDGEIRDHLGLNVGADVERADVPGYERDLREAYADRGYEGTTLSVRLLETGDDSRVVLFVEVDEGEPTVVDHVRFVGDSAPDGISLTRPLRSLEGDTLDIARIERARIRVQDRLREAGYLEAVLGDATVARDAAHATVSVPLALGPRVTIRVHGASPLDEDDVVDAIDATHASLDAAGLAGIASRARDFFLRSGFLDATATADVERSDDGRSATLYVDVERGPPVRIETLAFRGASSFSGSFLREQVESFLSEELRGSGLSEPVDAEVLDRLVGGTPEGSARRQPEVLYVPAESRYYAPAFDRAIEHLRSVYAADGYADVEIDPPTVTRTGVGTVDIRIEVREGPRITFFDVAIDGNVRVSDRALAEALDIDRGDPYSEAALTAGIDRILAHYRSLGYLYAAVEQVVRFSEDRTHAVVALRVNERFQVRVHRVRIEGARQTRESLIRNLVALREGDVFTPALARRTEERLLELGIFGSVVVAPADSDLPAEEKDVVVTVAERLPQVLDFGAGLSTGQGVRGSFEYSYRNLFGRAITFTMRAQLSGQFFFLDPILQERFQSLSLQDRLERRVTLTIALPILGSNPNWRTSFNALNLRDNARTFGVDKTAFDVTVSYRPTRRLAVTMSPTFERNNVGLLVSDQTYEDVLSSTTNLQLRQLLRVPEGRSTLVAFGTQLILDHRDNAFSPRHGAYLSTGLEWAHTLTTQQVERAGVDTQFFSHHLRFTVTGSTYVPLGSRATLALQGRYGRIIHLEDSSETFPNRQFFLGGVDTMRAYRQDAMIPQDIIDRIASSGSSVDKVALVQGAETFLLLRTEVRFPIFGDISGAAFGEFGNLWADVHNFQPWNLRPTAGVGIRLNTPVGPVALDYGFNLLHGQTERQAVGERFGAFNFSIGVY